MLVVPWPWGVYVFSGLKTRAVQRHGHAVGDEASSPIQSRSGLDVALQSTTSCAIRHMRVQVARHGRDVAWHGLDELMLGDELMVERVAEEAGKFLLPGRWQVQAIACGIRLQTNYELGLGDEPFPTSSRHTPHSMSLHLFASPSATAPYTPCPMDDDCASTSGAAISVMTSSSTWWKQFRMVDAMALR